MRTLLHVLSTSRLRQLWLIEIPYAIPSFLSGLRIASALAAVGAVVGEFVGSDRGLGHVLLRANADLQGPLTFAVLFLLLLVSSLLYALALVIDKGLKRIVGLD
jgi:ABC-type nitrate/sulfonate/bicarbonate transport system permease component